MYGSYFGFSSLPFECNLDQRFLYLSESHKEVLAALLYFIRERKGFALVCGDVGTGKTMLINQLLSRLSQDVQAIRLGLPYTDPAEFLPYIARCLGIRDVSTNSLELHNQVKAALIEANRNNTQVVLIIDEAHLLPNHSLEHIRILSNIETQQCKLLQILLVGQYELSAKLDLPEMRPLRQRININRFLMPMTAAETIGYIGHRLELVGSSYEDCFEGGCEKPIWRLTSGVPRRINQLCDNALLICKTEQKQKVNRKILKGADEALRTDRIFKPDPAAAMAAGRLWSRARRAFLAGLFGFVLLTAGILADAGRLGSDAQRVALRMKGEVSKYGRAARDSLWAVGRDKTYAGAQALSAGPGTAGGQADAAPGQAAGVLAVQPAGSPGRSGTDLPPVETLQANAGSRPASFPPAVEQQPAHPGEQPADAPAPQASSRQKNSQHSLLRGVRPTLPRPAVAESPAGETAAAAPANAADGSKDREDAKPLRREEAAPIASAAGANSPAAQAGARADEPSPQPVKTPEVVGRTAGEEGNKETQSMPADARRESAGGIESPGDGGEGAAKFGDSRINRHFPATASSRRVVVKRGDTLLQIAADQYPHDTDGGFQAIVRANPDISNPNQIFPGQTIVLPELNITPPGIRYLDNQYYADYGRYRSLEDLKQATQLLAGNTIRFFITALNDSKGDQVYQITLGGYSRLPDLARAIEVLKSSVKRTRTSG